MDVKKVSRNPLIYVALIGALLFAGFLLISNLSAPTQVTVQQGLELLKGDTVTKVVNTDGDQRVDLTLSKEFEGAKNVQFYYVEARADQVVEAIDAAEIKAKDAIDVVPRATWFDGFLSLLLPLVLLGLLFWWLLSSMQGGGSKVMQFGKSKAKLVNKETPTVTFADVAGAEEAIEELHEIKEFLQDPAKFRRAHPEGRAAVRPSRNRKDPARSRRGGRGGRSVLLDLRLGLRRDVRRRRGIPGARPVHAGQGERPGHHLHRRDRRRRSSPRCGHGRRQRRARADAEPDAG